MGCCENRQEPSGAAAPDRPSASTSTCLRLDHGLLASALPSHSRPPRLPISPPSHLPASPPPQVDTVDTVSRAEYNDLAERHRKALGMIAGAKAEKAAALAKMSELEAEREEARLELGSNPNPNPSPNPNP